jgi:hypothetical protein
MDTAERGMVWKAGDEGRPERPAWWLHREALLELAALLAEQEEEQEEGDPPPPAGPN